MRVLAAIVLVTAACHGGHHAARPADAPARAAPPRAAAASPWDAITALAVPTATSTGPADDLVRALQLATTDDDASIAPFIAWSRADGRLPPLPASFTSEGKMLIAMFELGKRASRSARGKTWEQIAAAAHLATAMIVEGRSLLEVTMGLDLVRECRAALHRVGDPEDSFPWPGPSELVRIVAAEALHSRAQIAWSTSDEGRREIEAEIAKLDPKTRNFVGDPDNLIPDAETVAGLHAFWLEALAGARRGEPAATTLDRLRRAREHAPSRTASYTDAIVRAIESTARELGAP